MGISLHLAMGADNDLYTDFHELFTGLHEEADKRDAEDHQKELDERRQEEDKCRRSDPAYQEFSDNYANDTIKEQDKCEE